MWLPSGLLWLAFDFYLLSLQIIKMIPDTWHKISASCIMAFHLAKERFSWRQKPTEIFNKHSLLFLFSKTCLINTQCETQDGRWSKIYQKGKHFCRILVKNPQRQYRYNWRRAAFFKVKNIFCYFRRKFVFFPYTHFSTIRTIQYGNPLSRLKSIKAAFY